jgi:glucose-6-phosphate 1-dehydrogenase
VHFKAPSRASLPGSASVLSFDMAPDGVTLDVHAAGPAGLPAVVPLRLEARRPRQPLPASARLLRDVLAGNPTLAVRDDETDECWRIVDSVLAGWRTGAPPLQEYAAGSAGPDVPCG